MGSKEIIKLLNKKYPKKEIIGIRGLIKTGENEYQFRYTYRSGDMLSISDLMFIDKHIKEKPVLVSKKIKQTH